MKIHWHFANPWRQKSVYVPVIDLAIAYASLSRSVDTVQRWCAHGEKLDAYVLPSVAGESSFSAGVRFGPLDCDYLSFTVDRNSIIPILQANAIQWRPCRWDDELSRPTKDGMYFVRIAGDCETDGPHVYYDYPDYTTTAMVKMNDGEDSIFVYCEHDEEPESIIAWYGPLSAPACDCF